MDSAVSRAFAIPELTEKILVQVAEPRPGDDKIETCLADLKDIYRCQRVSRTFASVIAGSKALQHVMSITSRSAEDYYLKKYGFAINAVLNTSCTIVYKGFRAEIIVCNTSSSEFELSVEIHDSRLAQGLRDSADASWKKMRCVSGARDIAVQVDIFDPQSGGLIAREPIKFDLPPDATLGFLADLLKGIRGSVMRGTFESGDEIIGVEIWEDLTMLGDY